MSAATMIIPPQRTMTINQTYHINGFRIEAQLIPDTQLVLWVSDETDDNDMYIRLTGEKANGKWRLSSQHARLDKVLEEWLNHETFWGATRLCDGTV